MWDAHTDSGNNVYGGQTAKNIYLGETRIVTKLNSGDEPTYNEEFYKQYYYHSDHPGPASPHRLQGRRIIKELSTRLTARPGWRRQTTLGLSICLIASQARKLTRRLGLYYYGARYLDLRYSRWISTDPALGEYIPSAGKATASEASSLPGIGGIFNTVNFAAVPLLLE